MSASGPEAEVHFGVPEDDFTLISGEPNEFHYMAQSGKGHERLVVPNIEQRSLP
jgi:hypothetical protein